MSALLAIVLLVGCAPRRAPPSVWLSPLPEASPPVVEQVEATPDDCPPMALLPGRPVTLDCRGQVLSDAEAIRGIAAEQAAEYWESQYRISARYRELDRLAAEDLTGSLWGDLREARREARAMRWAAALGVLGGMLAGAGMALGVAWGLP